MLRIKGGEVSSHDFFGRVSRDALGPCVPGRDVSVRIEHEDAVVLRAFHDQPKPRFAFLQLLLGLLLFGDIVQDDHSALEPAPQGPRRHVDGAARWRSRFAGQ